MTLRSMVLYGMIVVTVALLALAILGHSATRSLDQRLDKLATLRAGSLGAVDNRLDQMVSAIDHLSLVRAGSPTLEQLVNDSARNSKPLGRQSQ